MGLTRENLVIPFFLGQRRGGLCRVQSLSRENWRVIDLPGFQDRQISSTDEQLRRMGEIYSRLSDEVCRVASQDSIPVSLAGDCVSALGVLAGLQKAGRRPDQIVWLDAHGDFHTWETSLSGNIGGMSLAMLVGRGDMTIVNKIGVDCYPEAAVSLSDARDLDSGEKEALENSDIGVYAIEDLHVEPGPRIYLHWDTDFLDAADAMPALKHQVKGGPSPERLAAFFRHLRDHNIVAVSISAWYPENDASDRTASACLEILDTLWN